MEHKIDANNEVFEARKLEQSYPHINRVALRETEKKEPWAWGDKDKETEKKREAKEDRSKNVTYLANEEVPNKMKKEKNGELRGQYKSDTLKQLSNQKLLRSKKKQEYLTLKISDSTIREFPILFETEMGIPRKYQLELHKASHDDDYDTDDEQLERSVKHCLNEVIEVQEAILKKLKEKKRFKNTPYLSSASCSEQDSSIAYD